MFILWFALALPVALLMTGLSYLLTARQRREQRAQTAQRIEMKKRTDAESVQFSKECQAREAARQRKTIEHFAHYGTSGYRMPFDD